MSPRFLRLSTFTLLLVLLLSACGVSTTITLPPAPTTAPTVEPTATTAPAPTATQPPAPTETAKAAAEPTVEPTADAARVADLKLTGLVETEMAWSTADLKAMPAATGKSENNKGETQSYTGVLVASVLNLAAPKAEAKMLVFIGDGDAKLEFPLADIQSCADCLLTFRNQGGFSLLLPFYSKQLALKGIKEIQVK